MRSRLRYLPDWLVEFTHNLVKNICQDSKSGRPAKSQRSASVLTSRKTKIARSTSCKKRTAKTVNAAEKCGNLTTAKQEVFHEELGFHTIAGTQSTNKAGIWQILWTFITVSLCVNSLIWEKWYCWQSGAQVTEGTSALLQSSLDEQWWADFMDIQDLVTDGKTYKNSDFFCLHRGKSSIQFQQKTTSSATTKVRKCYLENSLFALYANATWNHDISVTNVEELENLEASDIHTGDFSEKEKTMSTTGKNVIFQTQVIQLYSLERIMNSENPHNAGQT